MQQEKMDIKSMNLAELKAYIPLKCLLSLKKVSIHDYQIILI